MAVGKRSRDPRISLGADLLKSEKAFIILIKRSFKSEMENEPHNAKAELIGGIAALQQTLRELTGREED